MIKPETFYDHNDLPGWAAKLRMWKNIKNEIHSSRFLMLHIADKRSFVWGMAVSAIIYFACVGVYSTVKRSLVNSQPQVIRLDAAYQSAIKEFENVVPQIVSANENASELNYLLLRKEQLSRVDSAIASLKMETTEDLSELKQRRLRELYGMKLRVLQEIIEKGEVEL